MLFLLKIKRWTHPPHQYIYVCVMNVVVLELRYSSLHPLHFNPHLLETQTSNERLSTRFFCGLIAGYMLFRRMFLRVNMNHLI